MYNKDSRDNMDYKELIESALSVLDRSYSVYSKYKVAAAVEMDDGSVYNGVNIENASYGLTICAERSAIANAITNGDSRKINKIAIVNPDSYPFPCGACRQFISEFTKDAEIIVAKSTKDYKVYNIKDLLPESFSLDDK
ncbi:cytidine deaminase [uncultured Fenollaria sp.]|uniref:cytidine deaminase n=1 Tax=uncultured Fenollaria sp. TaxID=1686315 RepID=UPI0025F28E7E|nr:cytidine deaminase [uncultured Fenollaria sp.]